MQPEILDLNQIINNMEGMLRRLIGEDISLLPYLAIPLKSVLADPSQIEQVIMNLVVNARDAIVSKPGFRGGHISIETKNVFLEESDIRQHPDIKPGDFVLLAVNDDGIGMKDEIKAHIFEPFFTTKEKGKGTGLGLSTVYGIVRQSGGHIDIESEWETGTTFKIYFPCAQDQGIVGSHDQSKREPARGHETILIVEDETTVRQLTRRILERYGYTVLDTSLPSEALHTDREHLEAVDLLITDVVMPEMGGQELAERLVALNPTLEVLYISGYTRDATALQDILHQDQYFLAKPFTTKALVEKVRDVLDRSRRKHP
jgi:CheY-like chemotaxis protein